MSDIKEVIKQEYLKCAKDPVYFLKKYAVIQHPLKGKVPFALYPFQEKSINDFKSNNYNIILNEDIDFSKFIYIFKCICF